MRVMLGQLEACMIPHSALLCFQTTDLHFRGLLLEGGRDRLMLQRRRCPCLLGQPMQHELSDENGNSSAHAFLQSLQGWAPHSDSFTMTGASPPAPAL